MPEGWEDIVAMTVMGLARSKARQALFLGAMRELRAKYGLKTYPDVAGKISEAVTAWDKHKGRKEPFCKLLFRSLTTRSKRPWVAPMREALLLLMQHKLMGDE